MILLRFLKKLNSENIRLIKQHFKRVKTVIKYRYLTFPIGMDMGKGSHINPPSLIFGKENIHLGDNCNIDWECRLYCTVGNFIMKNNSGAAVGLTVITNNHVRDIGEKKGEKGNSNLVGKDILVDEDVWIAANVTLLAGTHIGRGCIIGAGTVLRRCNIPPYAIVVGNPGKIIGFRYSPEEIIEHEKILYPMEQRLSLDILCKNYNKYFKSRVKEIKEYISI